MTDNSTTNASPEPAQPSAAPTESAAPTADLSPAALKTAYNAFKKRWKLTRLDYESRIGKNPLSSGGNATIVGIAGPREFPKAVWEELVKQGRLKHAGSGLYSMP